MPPATPVDDFARAAETLRFDPLLRHPNLHEAVALLNANRLGPASTLLRDFLKAHPHDVSALHLMAKTVARQGRNADAEALLAQCVELAPDQASPRFSYVNVLLQANKPETALKEIELLLKQEPRNPLFRRLEAVALEAINDYAGAAAVWLGLTEDYPARLECWLRYGHSLRGMGARDESLAAYRKVIELNPSFGGAWWALADLKSFRFTDAEIEQMEQELARSGLSSGDRTQLHFSLGKAYADKEHYEKSFRNYAKGNALHRLGFQHDPNAMTAYVASCKRLFTKDFFRERAGSGCDSADPIFLVGMARSGSTLVEQVLASHSRIEGTRELFNLTELSRQLQRGVDPNSANAYPDVLAKLDAATLKRLGELYLERTRIHRKLGRPFFTDKMGPSYVHIGLLQLILPNATIVDVRRHPLACCFSIFAQLFPKGQNDSYRLADIGRVYRDYVELMAHFDRVLPGKVRRIAYETLVAEPQAEIRRLLGAVGVSFEPACLEFYKTERVVTTASSEQVRTPIYRDALEHWRHYEPWLQPLVETLGAVYTAYPSVPEQMR
jgi:tetratricopeptide (TPR) repeat protein